MLALLKNVRNFPFEEKLVMPPLPVANLGGWPRVRHGKREEPKDFHCGTGDRARPFRARIPAAKLLRKRGVATAYRPV